MTIRTRKTERKDVEDIRLRDLFKNEEGAKENFLACAIYDSAPMATVFVGQEPAIILKGSMIWDGVMSLGALTSDAITKNPLGVVKAIRRLEKDNVKKLGLHRVQVTVRESEVKACLFVEHFGFKVEALMENFGADKSRYWLYARIY